MSHDKNIKIRKKYTKNFLKSEKLRGKRIYDIAD